MRGSRGLCPPGKSLRPYGHERGWACPPTEMHVRLHGLLPSQHFCWVRSGCVTGVYRSDFFARKGTAYATKA